MARAASQIAQQLVFLFLFPLLPQFSSAPASAAPGGYPEEEGTPSSALFVANVPSTNASAAAAPTNKLPPLPLLSPYPLSPGSRPPH